MFGDPARAGAAVLTVDQLVDAGGARDGTVAYEAADGCELAGIVARAEATIAKARGDWPGVPVFPSLKAMIEARACDAVTITTPPPISVETKK